MPDYRIQIASSDGAVDSPDPDGIALEEIGEARALVVETLIEAAKARVPADRARTICVTAYDERGLAVYSEEITIHGPAPSDETKGLWRALAAMNDGQPPCIPQT